MNVKALSGADVARCFGVDRSMVTRWKKAGMPETKGLFCLPECIKWRLEREAEALAPKNATPEGERWLTAFRKERAKMARLERLEKQGKLLPKADILKLWVTRFSWIRQGLLSLPWKLPVLLDGKCVDDMRPVVKKAVYDLLTNLSRTSEFTPLPDEIIELIEKIEMKEKGVSNEKS